MRQWTRTVGGLVSALDPAVRARGGTWIAAAEEDHAEAPPPEVAGYRVIHVPLSDAEIDGHYRRVSNGVLWPLMHSFPTRVRTKDAPWEMYREVNERFAARAIECERDAVFWVQDFQLTLVPAAIRRRRPRARIGWFNHVPFPAPELFAMLPERRAMLDGLLGADLLGFQTERDADNFMSTVEVLLGIPVDYERGLVQYAGRSVSVRAFPIGIDIDAMQVIAADPDVRAVRERMRESFGSQRLLLAVDRLDYTKGLPERLEAFSELLERHPRWRQRVSLVQVAVPSRTEVEQYASLKRSVDELVGQINGRYGSPRWMPIHYLYRAFDLTDLAALYTLADVAVITPLRDGMNLVAQEFAASRNDNRGVLVLSEFAGAATILEGALRVNPYDIPRTADALDRALEMPVEEQEERMRRIRNAVRKHRVGLWQAAFLDALESPSGVHRSDAGSTGRYPRLVAK